MKTGMINMTVWNHHLNEQVRNLNIINSSILDKALFWFVLFIFSVSQPFTKKSFTSTDVIPLLVLR